MIFHHISELMLATLIHRKAIKKIRFIFYPVQERETNWFFTGCQMPYFMMVLILYINLFKLSWLVWCLFLKNMEPVTKVLETGWPGGQLPRLWIMILGLNATGSGCKAHHCTEPFIITLPSSRYDLNDVQRDVKHQTIIIQYTHLKLNLKRLSSTTADLVLRCLLKRYSIFITVATNTRNPSGHLKNRNISPTWFETI